MACDLVFSLSTPFSLLLPLNITKDKNKKGQNIIIDRDDEKEEEKQHFFTILSLLLVFIF